MTSESDTPSVAGVHAGMVIIREGFYLPEGLVFMSHSYSDNWRLVESLDGVGVDAEVSRAGWWFMFLSQSLHATCLGSGSVKSIRRAMNRILAEVDSRDFNSMEVTEVSRRRFLRIPYVAITAHPRHIQKSQLVENQAVRRQARERKKASPATYLNPETRRHSNAEHAGRDLKRRSGSTVPR